MEVMKLAEELFKSTVILDEAIDELDYLAEMKIEAERKYRRNLAGMMIQLRHEKVPVNILKDVALGKIADLAYERDKAEADYKTCISKIDAIKIKISALQSINRHASEL